MIWLPSRIRTSPKSEILLNHHNDQFNVFHVEQAVGSHVIPAKDDGQMWWLSVSDTGEGIIEEDQERIFESFTHTSSKTFTQHRGKGLGLALVKQLTRLMGGYITLESTHGEGSTFCVCVPTAPKPS